MSHLDWKVLRSSAPCGSERVPRDVLLKGLGGVAGPCFCSSLPPCSLWRAAGGSASVPAHAGIDYKPVDLCLDCGNAKGNE